MQMNKLDRGFLVTIIIALAATIALLAADIHRHDTIEAELAGARYIVTTDHAIKSDEASAAIRQIEGHYYNEGIIETQDGNTWNVNTEGINPFERLLIWFDTMGTPETEDDQIIEIWRAVYD